MFFALDQNKTVWFGYKLRNDSENFGLVRNEFQSETFARLGILFHNDMILRIKIYWQCNICYKGYSREYLG